MLQRTWACQLNQFEFQKLSQAPGLWGGALREQDDPSIADPVDEECHTHEIVDATLRLGRAHLIVAGNWGGRGADI